MLRVLEMVLSMLRELEMVLSMLRVHTGYGRITKSVKQNETRHTSITF